LKSPTAADVGFDPAWTLDVLSATEEVGLVISKKTKFEVPPGLGLTTFTQAVPALAMSVARMLAFNRELLAKVVARLLPFHFTTEPETNPVPFTVRVNPAAPGLIASGRRGWLIKGTGTAVPAIALASPCSCVAETRVRITANKAIAVMHVNILDFMLHLVESWESKGRFSRTTAKEQGRGAAERHKSIPETAEVKVKSCAVMLKCRFRRGVHRHDP